MEEAAELAKYLPLSFRSPKEQEYIEFLWDAFETNYTHGKYVFNLFLQSHLCRPKMKPYLGRPGKRHQETIAKPSFVWRAVFVKKGVINGSGTASKTHQDL